MYIKVNVKTPKHQAAKCIETQKKALLGFGKSKEILEQKVVAHNKFYWIVECPTQKDYEKVIKKSTVGEIMIKKFYHTLIKLITRANKLAGKFKKGFAWIKRFIIRKFNKYYQNQDNELVDNIKNMSDDEFKDFIEMTDLEDMQILLAGSLIDIDVIDWSPKVA